MGTNGSGAESQVRAADSGLWWKDSLLITVYEVDMRGRQTKINRADSCGHGSAVLDVSAHCEDRGLRHTSAGHWVRGIHFGTLHGCEDDT
jgi:hypothetical protein